MDPKVIMVLLLFLLFLSYYETSWVPFSFQIVGFHGTGAVVRCFEDRKENEHDLIFQVGNV